MGRGSTAALAVVVLLSAAALVVPIGASPLHPENSAKADATGSITVAATKDYGYQPDTFQQVPTNATITVTFTDDDVLQHSFNISSREGFVIPTSYTPAQLDHLFGTYPALFSATVNGPGDQYVGTFRSPATPGWYEFVCNVTGQFQNGMYGFIAFGENLPSNLTIGSGLYALTFSETTLPPRTNWSVTLTGNASAVILLRSLAGSSVIVTRWSDGASTIRFNVSNGNYSYSASAPGYSTNTSTLSVDGHNVPEISVGFTVTPPSSGPSILDYVLLGVVIAVVAIGAAVVLIRRRGKTPPNSATPPPVQ